VYSLLSNANMLCNKRHLYTIDDHQQLISVHSSGVVSSMKQCRIILSGSNVLAQITFSFEVTWLMFWKSTQVLLLYRQIGGKEDIKALVNTGFRRF